MALRVRSQDWTSTRACWRWRERIALLPIEWHEASAKGMPFQDETFDVVLCQMGLQFVPNKLAALREMRRVLVDGGRVLVMVPGPKPRLFAIMTEGLARHLSPEAASFTDLVFSMHDADELAELMRSTGFRDVDVQVTGKTLRVPPPAEFLWQYIHSTPMAEAAVRADADKCDALEREVCPQWREFVTDGHLEFQVGVTTATARK